MGIGIGRLTPPNDLGRQPVQEPLFYLTLAPSYANGACCCTLLGNTPPEGKAPLSVAVPPWLIPASAQPPLLQLLLGLRLQEAKAPTRYAKVQNNHYPTQNNNGNTKATDDHT